MLLNIYKLQCNIGVDFLKIEIGTNEAGQRLDKFLRKYLKDVPLSAIFKALRKGDIRVNGAKKKENYPLELGDIIEIRYLQSKQEKKEDTFIAGLSMGGYGAIRNGLKYHDTFGYIAGLSSAMILEKMGTTDDSSPMFFEKKSFLESVFW